GYDPATLAQLGRRAWEFLRIRRPGAAKIRFDVIEPEPAMPAKAMSLLEVVTDDMPFLLDSVLAELAERGLSVRLVAHPVFTVGRDSEGHLTQFIGEAPPGEGALRESCMHIHLAPVGDEVKRTETVQGIEQVLQQVRLAVQDWRPMLQRAS